MGADFLKESEGREFSTKLLCFMHGEGFYILALQGFFFGGGARQSLPLATLQHHSTSHHSCTGH